MSLSTQILHTVPIQISINDSIATITCNDPRAKLVGDVIEFTLNYPNPKDPAAQPFVCFVVDDPPDAGGYDNYLNMSSAPPFERLLAWKRSGTTSRSMDMRTGYDYEVVAVAYSVPGTNTQPSASVKIGSGRRRFKIRDSGGGGSEI